VGDKWLSLFLQSMLLQFPEDEKGGSVVSFRAFAALFIVGG